MQSCIRRRKKIPGKVSVQNLTIIRLKLARRSSATSIVHPHSDRIISAGDEETIVKDYIDFVQFVCQTVKIIFENEDGLHSEASTAGFAEYVEWIDVVHKLKDEAGSWFEKMSEKQMNSNI